ncbi:sorting nexin-19-like [Acanthaster planci]|uniref:Sorting nexin-19-like n=1 Tax=Acanthaster planci TaxID=133434 RepID=A0A8B7ZFW1_ACAPL|nr:sorting nexin-19-like [Acanthaster planci]
MNVQFSDIDNQFAFEDSPRDVSTATSVINSGFLTDLQIKQSNSANDINGEFTQNRETQERRSGPSKAVPFSDGVGLESTCTQTSVSATYAEIPDFSQPQDKETSRPQLISLGVNAAGSSPIKKLLKRVSFSKKKHPKPQCEIASSGSPQVSTGSQSAPVSLPISIQTPGSSAINQKISHPTSSTISINSDMQALVTPAAEDPKTTGTCISVSAPEMFSASASRFLEGTPSLKITNLTIPEAEVCKEFGGKGEFFLYSIQFDVVPTITPSSSTENIQRCDLGPVHKITKRRHREFVNLHSRLEHNFQLKPSLKGIHDVPKRLSIPLAPTAKPAIDQRRISHQHYLQQLLARPLLHCSRELAEFLALEGNTHIEYVRHHPREYVPRIDKMLRNRVSGLVESIKHARSAIPRALSDIGPLPPMSPPMSPVRKSRGSHQETDKKVLSPPTSQRPGSPSPIDEQDGSGGDRIFVFDRRPKTTVQLATCSIIQDHSMKTCANVTSPAYRPAATTPINHHSLGPRSNGDGYESPEMAPAETPSDERESSTVLGSEKVALLDSVLCFLGDIFHDKDLWFLDEGFQSVLTILAGDLLDGWIERQVNLLLSDQWCAFYMAELREALWPGGKLLSANEGTGTRTEAEKAATMKEVLTMLVDAMPDLFYTVVDKQDWQDGLQLLLDSLGDPQLNRHLLFTILDLMMDALISEIKDEDFQKNLISRI